MRRLVGIAAAIALIGLPTAVSVPANAASFSVTVIGDRTVTPNTVTASPTSVNAAPGDTISISYSLTAGSAFTFLNVYNGTGQVTEAGTACTSMSPCDVSPPGTLILTVVSTGSIVLDFTGTRMDFIIGSGGGGDSASNAATAPVLETLTIQTTTGNTTCTGGSPTGYRGEWMTLPAADACSQSGPDAKPNAKLLGWATNPNFPVAIAQRQVDNGWGAYETFNEDGQMTGVFIPAGGATFVSASTNLYPIWSS